MNKFKKFFKNLFGITDKNNLVCIQDQATGDYFCYEVKQGGYVKVPGGPYKTIEECNLRKAEG
jgi:hypothetical protein